MYISLDHTTSLAQPVTHGGMLAHTSAEIICPMVYVPNIIVGAPAQVAQFLSAGCMNLPGAYMFVRFSSSILEPHRVRIGEGGNVGSRLAGKIDEWATGKYSVAVAVTCSHPRWDKTCAENLEARLTAIIEGSRTAEVERERAPKLRHLPPDAQQAMDSLIDHVRVELERRRIPLLTQAPPAVFQHPSWQAMVPAAAAPVEVPISTGFADPVRVLSLFYEDLSGELEERADHVIIRRGTEVCPREVAALQTASRAARRALIETGAIVMHPTKPDRWILTKDHKVGSLTTAARIVTGSTQSGTHVWRPGRKRLN